MSHGPSAYPCACESVHNPRAIQPSCDAFIKSTCERCGPLNRHLHQSQAGGIHWRQKGEPLANYRRVREAIRRLIEEMGMSPRSLTVSTVGVVPGIRRLASEG